MSKPVWKTAIKFTDITYKKSNGVARIAFNRPDVRNAFRPKTTSELYKAFIADIIDNAHKLKCELITIAYTPSNAEAAFHGISGQSVNYFPQKGNNLGERMKNAFKRSFDKGSTRTVIISPSSALAA